MVPRSRARAKAQNRELGRITSPEEAQRAKRAAGPGSRAARVASQILVTHRARSVF